MAHTCGICGRSGILIGGAPCVICGIHVCGAHQRMQCSFNQDLACHVMNQAPDSLQKNGMMSLTNHGKNPLLGALVCSQCYGWVDFWSKDLYKKQDAARKKYTLDQHLSQAQKYERAGRFEDAAKEYEKAEAWDEAGRVRKEGSTQVVKSVNVDLNKLLDDLRRGGLALNYRCHSCGGGITIGSGGVEAPKFCPYCGIMIDSRTLSDILRTALR